MHPRHLLTLHSQLALPMIPLAIDTVVRTIFLWGDIEWWRIPDLWTLLVTYAFFCLAVMFSVNVPRIATDPEAHDNIELVKHGYWAAAFLPLASRVACRVFAQLLIFIPR